MTQEHSPLYTSLLRAMGIVDEENTVVATAWGRDYTLGDFDRMTDKELRRTKFKVKTYNLWLRLLLVVSNIRVWFWRTLDELVTGLRMIF